MFKIKYFLLSAILCLGIGLKASHIMGGNIVFEHLQGQNYLVGIKVFVDCYRGNPGAFYESDMVIGMHSQSADTLAIALPLNLQPGFDQKVQITRQECADPVDFCMYVAYYCDTFMFDEAIFNDPKGYYISWERCCRNAVVLNVRDPDEIGTAFYAEVPPFSIKNSSPIFTKTPISLLCLNSFFKYNFGIKDPDGDSLSMSLVTPLRGRTSEGDDNSIGSASYPLLEPKPYAEVTWDDGFDINNIMQGNPDLSIDPFTGIATVKPKRQGDYAFAVKVEEFRNGVKIGEVIREMQYKVSTCASNKPPKPDQNYNDSVFSIYPGETLTLNWQYEDESGDSIYMSSASTLYNDPDIAEPFASFLATNGEGRAKATFIWKPNCEHISSELYEVTIDATDNGCPLPTTNSTTFYIKVLDPPIYPKPADFCVKRLEGDSLQLNWKLAEYGSYFGGIIIEQKLEGGNWQTLDSIGKKQIRTYNLSVAQNDEKNVCFRITAVNICGVRGEVSDSFCSVLHVGVPPLQSQLLNVTVNNDEAIELSWTKNLDFDFNSYQIYRAINGDLFDYYLKIEDADQIQYVDEDVLADSNYYSYYIKTIDDCNDNSPKSETGSSILLKGNISAYKDSIYWTKFDLWSTEQYKIKGIGSPSNSSFTDFNDATQFYYVHVLSENNDGKWQYRIKAENTVSGFESYSNSLELTQMPVVWIPTVFSPNNDNLNEIWKINADFVSEYYLQVYNRWGQKVFETENPKDYWDGLNAFDGVYLYKLTYRDLTGRITFKTGSVHIIN